MSTHALGWPQNGKILNSDLDSEDKQNAALKSSIPGRLFFRKYTITAQPKVALPCNRKIRVVSILIYIGHISQQKIH